MQRSTKHTPKIKDRVTRTPLKNGGELRCSGRESSFCPTHDTCHVNLVTNQVICHKWGHDRVVFTSGTYPWSFGTHIFYNGKPNFFHKRPSLSISRCRSRYEAGLSISVVSFISSSMGFMWSIKSPNLELFSERTCISSI